MAGGVGQGAQAAHGRVGDRHDGAGPVVPLEDPPQFDQMEGFPSASVRTTTSTATTHEPHQKKILGGC